MLILPLAPQQRPDPRHAKTWGERVFARNSDEYTAWLGAATLLVRTMWQGAHRPKVEGPVALELVFVLQPPKRMAAKLHGLPVAVRPDLDRYVHAIQDAITQAGNVWTDDGQVARVTASKRYAHEGEPPSVHFDCGPEPGNHRAPAAGVTPVVRPVRGHPSHVNDGDEA